MFVCSTSRKPPHLETSDVMQRPNAKSLHCRDAVEEKEESQITCNEDNIIYRERQSNACSSGSVVLFYCLISSFLFINCCFSSLCAVFFPEGLCASQKYLKDSPVNPVAN